MRLRHLYILSHGDMKYLGLVEISDDNYVGDTPLEDYGDYLCTTEPTDTPFEDWLAGI